MRLVMGVSDRILVLDYGRRLAEGTAEAVRNDPRVIEAYLGAGGE
jgi:branched-chain amino acid transport system ATP-binding protein